MQINWKLRFKNKVTLTAIVVQLIAIVYAALSMANFAPKIGEDAILSFVYMIIELLCLLGIVVDPTTEGAKDSQQALLYSCPKK